MSNVNISAYVENRVKEIYENYRIGYVGGNFSNAFQKWNETFISCLENLTPIPAPIVRVTPIGEITYLSVFIDGNIFHIIENIDFNTAFLSRVEASSMVQNRTQGVTRKATIISVAPNRYVFARDGGTLNGIPVEIVKRDASRTRKPIYVENYRITDTTGVRILSQYDLKSANRFENNQAIGWGVDGRQYIFDSSYLNESRKRKIMLKESQLRGIIRESIKRILNIA